MRLKFYASVRLDIRRTGAIKKGDEVLGSETRVKVVKNKVAPPFKQADFEIFYGQGISRLGEIIEFGVKFNLIDKSGAWYSYKGNRIGQGKDNVRQFLSENPEIAKEIETTLRTKLLTGGGNVPCQKVQQTKILLWKMINRPSGRDSGAVTQGPCRYLIHPVKYGPLNPTPENRQKFMQ